MQLSPEPELKYGLIDRGQKVLIPWVIIGFGLGGTLSLNSLLVHQLAL